MKREPFTSTVAPACVSRMAASRAASTSSKCRAAGCDDPHLPGSHRRAHIGARREAESDDAAPWVQLLPVTREGVVLVHHGDAFVVEAGVDLPLGARDALDAAEDADVGALRVVH